MANIISLIILYESSVETKLFSSSKFETPDNELKYDFNGDQSTINAAEAVKAKIGS